MRYYPLPRAQVKPARPNRTARLGVADFPRRAATTGRRAKCKALIRLGERRVPTIGQRDINRLLPSRARERRYFVGAAKGNSLCVMPSMKALGAGTAMLNLDDELPLGGNLDMERIIIDPDYRRLVLANLRADRLRAEAAALRPPPAVDAAPTLREI